MEVTLRLKHWRMKLASEYCDYLEMKPEEKMRSLSDDEKVVLYSRLMLHILIRTNPCGRLTREE